MAAKKLSPAGKIPAAQLKTLLTIAALAIVLPLVIWAAKSAQELRSKASYSCVGRVTDISFSLPCIAATATPTNPRTSITPSTPRITVTIGDPDPRRVVVTTTISPNDPSAARTVVGNDGTREDAATRGIGILPSGTRVPNGYKGATINCEGGYSEVVNSDVCLTPEQFSARARTICNDHAVCDTPAGNNGGKPSTGNGGGKPSTTPTGAPNKNPRINTNTLNEGRAGSNYMTKVFADDLDKSDSISMDFTNLPPGLYKTWCDKTEGETSQLNCEITGTPTTPGVYNVKVIITDSNGSTVTKSMNLVIK